MHPLLAPFLACCGVLAVAGVSKVRHPDATGQALRTQGWPSSRRLVRALGCVEVAVALAAGMQVPAGAALLGLSFAAFTGFVLLALVRGRPLSSCGCFGESDVPPTLLHAVLTGAAAGVAATVALGGPAGLPELFGGLQPGTAVAALGSAALIGWLATLVLTALPRLSGLRAPVLPAATRRSPA